MGQSKFEHGYRKFDDTARQRLAGALSVGDSLTVFYVLASGGKQENRRRACRETADQVLRKIGGFPFAADLLEMPSRQQAVQSVNHEIE